MEKIMENSTLLNSGIKLANLARTRRRISPSWCVMQMEFPFYGTIPLTVENMKRLRVLSHSGGRNVFKSRL